MKREQFDITGMTCSACSARVERAVNGLPGVAEASVSLLQNRLSVRFDEEKTSSSAIVRAVEAAGYGAAVTADRPLSARPESSAPQTRALARRFWTSLAFLLPLMYLTMGHMAGLPRPWAEHPSFLALAQLALTLPVLWINRAYFVNGFKNLWRGAPNMDSLIAVGAGAAAAYGVWMSVVLWRAAGRGDDALAWDALHHLYFESAVMIVTLVTLGKWLETRAKYKTSSAISALMRLAPQEASVRRNGAEITLPAQELTPGDVVLVRAGGRIAADGTVSLGHGAVDESALTGESVPVGKNPGDAVCAGTVNLEGYFEFTVTRAGRDTALARIIKLVEDANATKAPIARLADKVSGVFVPAVIGAALLTVLAWLGAGADAEFALSAGISVLVISCPCALGLATPTAIMVGTGWGARHGILIKSAQQLEAAARVDCVVLDKTGTVTTGRPTVTRLKTASGASETELLRLSAALERLSQHPFARAVEAAARAHGVEIPSAGEFELVPGRGVRAVVQGKKVIGGNASFMRENGADVSSVETVAAEAAFAGQTPLFFAADGRLLGLMTLADTVKPQAAEVVQTLQGMGVFVLLLTGDNAVTARAVARTVGIREVSAGVLPEGKENQIRRLQESGKKVAMVGDGVNDAPALARADVGVALGAGTDVSIESAGVVLMKDDLRDVPVALALSRAVLANIKQNLFWAFVYNVIGIPLAAGAFYAAWGWKLSPMFAAAAMSASSVCVVSNALRLRFFKPRRLQLKKREDGMKKTLIIEGMACSHCSRAVERALNALDGVHAEVNLSAKTAVVTAAADVSDEVLKKAVQDAGYEVVAVR